MPYEPNLDPAFIARNVASLGAIGGVYDLLAVIVYQRHEEILREAGFGSFESLTNNKIRIERNAHAHHEGRAADRHGPVPDANPRG